MPEDLPPLPRILNEDTKRRIFTHRSFYARPAHGFEDSPDDPSPDNEMLEHLGDSVLSLVVTGLLREVYPYLRVGPSTKIRALLVGNLNLALISVMYKLPDHLITHPAQAITLRASPNIQADLFEAYVGGLYQDSGLEITKAWLHPLFKPFLSEAYRIIRVQHGLPYPPEPPRIASHSGLVTAQGHPMGGPWSPPPVHSAPSIGHLSLFNQHLQQNSKSIEWVYSDSAGEGSKTTPIWVVRAMVDGQCLGRGRGSTKKVAKNEAAKEGLKTMKVYVPLPPH